MTIDRKVVELQIVPLDGPQFVPNNESEIRSLESAIGQDLPHDYRTFLSTYGECAFDVLCKIPTDGGGIYPGYFLSVNEIVESLKYVDEYLPQKVIPINDDGGGNSICISTRDDSYGKVYFRAHTIGFDYEADDEDAAKMDAMFPLSGNFTDFILALQPDDGQ